MPLLTARQAEVLDTIKRLSRDLGYSPSRRELAAALGLVSVGAVNRHVGILERKGYLRHVPGLSRTLVPVDPPPRSNKLY